MDTLDTLVSTTPLTTGLLVIDSNLQIIAMNDAVRQITGFPEDSLLFRQYDQLLTQNSAESCLMASIRNNQSFSKLELECQTVAEGIISVQASILPLKSKDASSSGVVVTFYQSSLPETCSLEDQISGEKGLDEKSRLQAIFDSLLDGTFTIDNKWVITAFNPSAERITGYSAQEVLGKPCWEIFRSQLCRNGCHMECSIIKQEPIMGNELLITRKNGQLIPIRVSSAPLFSRSGEHIGGVESFQDISDIKNLTNHLEERFRFENIIGHSKSLQKIYVLMDSVVQTDSTVLITGESGTGKELVARAIHLKSKRKLGPFMPVNCSAYAESLLESELFGHEKGSFTGASYTKPGKFEQAYGGTLFLDEIGDISPAVQVKLLRVLETKEFERVGATQFIHVNARIIAATNKNLVEEIEKGRFREDLYYRLNVIGIELPPLRNRLEDLPLLLENIMEKFRIRFDKNIKGISASVMRIFQNYSWPGNIRELENILEHACVLCRHEVIQLECLPEHLWYDLDTPAPIFTTGENPVGFAEKQHIQNTLKKFKGHRGKTAMALGMDKSTLWRKMKRFQIN
ncbi:MAG: sigma 54-interacting transcriptional regulator [SAR324 cluster bacterium]|nr:sigma 54-interacting transcriptional regulator [SAR324 cluster bacterium]